MIKYFVYEEGKLILKGYLRDIVDQLPFSKATLQKGANSGEVVLGKYKIESIDDPSTNPNKLSVERKGAFYRKKEDEITDDEKYQNIVKCLEEYGNTNIVEDEMNLLPKLKEKYRLDIKHYPSKPYSFMLDNDDTSFAEDWIITDLDYKKETK